MWLGYFLISLSWENILLSNIELTKSEKVFRSIIVSWIR